MTIEGISSLIRILLCSWLLPDPSIHSNTPLEAVGNPFPLSEEAPAPPHFPARLWQESVIAIDSDDFIKRSVCARGWTSSSRYVVPALTGADVRPLRLRAPAVAKTHRAALSSVILLSLAGNDLIILQMNRGINLFHKHFLSALIKSARARGAEECGKESRVDFKKKHKFLSSLKNKGPRTVLSADARLSKKSPKSLHCI